MFRLPGWRRGAFALTAIVSAIAVSQVQTPDDAAPSDGAVEIAYLDSTEIRAGEGWAVQCDDLGTLDSIVVTCTPEGVTLKAMTYDPGWGEHPLVVTQSSGDTRIDVTYRVRMEPPPQPEIAVTRLDVPIPVGAQTMFPLSSLGITCAACSVDGGASVQLGELPAGVSAGVSETHLMLRSSVPGDAVVPVQVTDDAGQSSSAELTVSFVSGAPLDTGALHIVSSSREWDLTELSWGDDRLLACSTEQSIGIDCSSDASAVVTAEEGAQLFFRVIGGRGQQAWGSVTFDANAERDLPASQSWSDEAPLHLVSPPPEDEAETPTVSPLATLALLLEGVPGS